MPEATTTETTATEPPATEAPGEQPAKPDGPKGGHDAVLADLAAERDKRQAAEKRAKAAEAELEKRKAASMSEQEKAIADARAEARKEALSTATDRLVRAEIKATAADRLADPGDAVAHLRDSGGLERFVDEDGEVDLKAVSSAIDDLVKSKPYLARQAKPGALPGGGARPSNGPTMDDWLRDQASSRGR